MKRIEPAGGKGRGRGAEPAPSDAETLRALAEILRGDEALRGGLPAGAEQRLLRLAERMLEVNRSMNLTALTTPEAIAYLHFYDSLSLLPLLDALAAPADGALRLCDVGSGAGFPGLPLKIARPHWEVQLFDALNKRVRYLRETGALLGLDGLDCRHIRAEEAGRMPEFRERFDAVTARAVAALPELAELCLPLVRVGGLFIAMKAAQAEEELAAARTLIARLGGEVEHIERLRLPRVEREHVLIALRKRGATPKSYPRSMARIRQAKG